MDAKELLERARRKIVPVDDPLLGGTVYVRSLSVAESSVMVNGMRDGETPEDIAENVARQIASFLCNEDGSAMLTMEQAREFCAGNFMATRRIVEEGNRLNTPTKSTLEEVRGN